MLLGSPLQGSRAALGLRKVPFGTALLGHAINNDVLAQGGVGLEYFTRLRHFSLGVMVDGLYFTDAKASGLSVVPTLRYTF